MRYGSGYPYILYALTVSGVAYLIKLKPSLSYASSTVLPQTEIMELNVKLYAHYEAITAAAATAGCFMIGGNDGSVSCFQFGTLDPAAPGVEYHCTFHRNWWILVFCCQYLISILDILL